MTVNDTKYLKRNESKGELQKMKKIISLIAACALMLVMLAGCGNSAKDDASANNGSDSSAQTTDTTNTNDANTSNTDSKDSDDSATAALSGTVSTNGSTSMEKVISGLIEAFTAENPDVKITYEATGSGTGITAASEGTTDIGLSSRNLKAEETGLKATVVALDGIAVIVNNSNSVENLTIEQIAGLANGTITNWKDVGGADAPVAVIGREAGSGTRDGFESIVGVEDACVYDQELNSTGAVIAAVAANEYAIGYASLSAVSDEIKAVSVNGVACTEETVLDGTYEIQRPFVMVTKEGAQLSDAAQAFIDFALSDAAEEIISNAGAVKAK